MKLQCILDILVICQILCYIMFIEGNLHLTFYIGKDILISNQIHQNQFFIYFDGFKYLVYYNLAECYSLVIFFINSIVFF